MTVFFVISMLSGLVFFFFGARQLIDARKPESDFGGSVGLASIFFMIGLVAVVIGIAGLLGFYMRPPPAEPPGSPIY
jgi:hypothetical protein